MFKARNYLAGISLAMAASAAHAGITATPAVTTDYDFRSVSQSAGGPAASLGVDYNTGGLHIGTWLSTIEWGPAYDGNMEWDMLADYTFGSDDTVKVNVGVIDYMYPSMTDQNTIEPWVTLSKKWFSASVRYSDDWFTLGHSWYYEANGTFPVGETGFAIVAHVGHSSGEAWKGIEYTDGSLSVTKSFGNFTGALKYVTSDAAELTSHESLAAYGKSNVFDTRDRVILTISTTLPWASK
jgi:uncharacterized protein (TIGR02001 family)